MNPIRKALAVISLAGLAMVVAKACGVLVNVPWMVVLAMTFSGLTVWIGVLVVVFIGAFIGGIIAGLRE